MRTPLPILALSLLLAACGDDPTGVGPGDLPRQTVAAGTDHACALASDGTAWCWGGNRLGQLGAPDVELWSWTPVAVASGRRYVSIAASTTNAILGPHVTCALTEGGEAYCWGTNLDGLIADEAETCSGVRNDASYSYPCSRFPRRVAPALRFAQITVGGGFICGVTDDGEAWCWGTGTAGQLGNGAMETSADPVRVSGGHRFVLVSAGDRHACALDTDGVAWCWGDDAEGQLGDGATTASAVPVRVDWASRFTTLDAGDVHACAIDAEGEAVCWGSSASYRLGRYPTPNEPLHGPIAVEDGHQYRTLSAGLAGACGITRDGTTVCWGELGGGEEGSGPVAIAGPEFSEVSDGFRHACGRASGDVYCWGDNGFPSPGQLGVGDQVEFSAVPLRVALP